MQVKDNDGKKDEALEEEEALDEDSSGGSGSESSGESGDDNASDEEPPPPPIELPERSTRAQSVEALEDHPRLSTIAEEEEVADNDFWQQEFFAEEGVDGEYSADSDSQDSGDSDFSDPEEEDKDDDGTEEALRSVLKLKKPKEKPPGHKQAALRKAAQARAKKQREAKAAGEPGQAAAKKEAKKVRFTEPAEPASAPSLRRSTKVRTAATISAEKQRANGAQRRPAGSRAKPKEAPAALRMVDVLQRAAADQLANQASLQALIAREADLKAKANQKASAARGPRVRWRYFSDLVPDPGGTDTADAAAASENPDPAAKNEERVDKGGGSKRVRVGRCTLAFVEMTPDTVPAEYRRKALSSLLRPPSDMCVKTDGSMRARVRQLLPEETAQTAGESPPPGAAGLALSSRHGGASATCIGDRMLGAVEGAITGRLRSHYGDMASVVESVDGFQGARALAAQHMAAMCAPDPMRDRHSGAAGGVGAHSQGGAHVPGLGDAQAHMMMHSLHASPYPHIDGGMGMHDSSGGSSLDARWHSVGAMGQASQGSGGGGANNTQFAAPVDSRSQKGSGRGAKGKRGKPGKGGGRGSSMHAEPAAMPTAPIAPVSHNMHVRHGHAPIQTEHGNIGIVPGSGELHGFPCVGLGAAGAGQQAGGGGIGMWSTASEFRPLSCPPLGLHPALNHANREAQVGLSGFTEFQLPDSIMRPAVDHSVSLGGVSGKLDGGVSIVGGIGNGVRNGHHAPVGDATAGAGLPLDGPASQLPRNGVQHWPPPNGGRF